MSDLHPSPLLLGPADYAEPSLRAKRARALAAVGHARAANFLPRLVSSGVVAVVAVAILGSVASLIWFAGLAGLVVIDRSLYVQLARRSEAGGPPENTRAMIAWTAAQSTYGNLLAPALWFAPYMHGETLAMIYIIAGLANAATSLRAYTPLALAGMAPTIACLLGLPVADYVLDGGRNALDLMPLIGSLLFLAFGFNLWRSLSASDAAQARAEASALRERQAANAAAAAKSDTIRRMRDELRTPMTALIGAAEHLRRAAATPEARQHIGMLVQAGDLLRLVLDDLSDLDRLENGMLRVEPKPTDVRDLSRGVAGAFRAAAHDKGLELFLDVARDMPCVEIDPLRVRQILFNLIANAVRYTTHGGVRVDVSWQPAEAPGRVRLAFAVSDTGQGMSRSQLAVVLGRSRLAGEGQRQAQGPGLGLSISLKLARLMGAQLTARSELGQGSVFSFVIEAPVAQADTGLRGRSAA